MKTSELTGAALDWAVAKCEGVEVEYIDDGITRCILRISPFTGRYSPSTDWSQGGPIIERELFDIANGGRLWWARKGDTQTHTGGTPLIAAMRCNVASKLGDEVDAPDELISA